VLLQYGTAQQGHDAVVALALSLAVQHLPIAQPEIELVLLGAALGQGLSGQKGGKEHGEHLSHGNLVGSIMAIAEKNAHLMGRMPFFLGRSGAESPMAAALGYDEGLSLGIRWH
jgi:hypothetical protein